MNPATTPLAAAWTLTDAWPVADWSCAVMWRTASGVHLESRGDTSRPQRIASVSKPLTAWAVLVAAEEGSISLDDPVGQSGCTVAHLLCHAGGYPFEGAQPVGRPGAKRIYSNAGYDLLAGHVEASTGMAFAVYLAEAVFIPLGMDASELRGSCAKDVWSCVDDLVAFVDEVRNPSLVAPDTALSAVTAQMPSLSGVVPGVGSFDPCPWGFGFEVRGHKSPHWTGTRNSASTHGHFGGVGTFLWIDPVADAATVMLSETEFDAWGLAHWPAFSDAVLAGLGR